MDVTAPAGIDLINKPEKRPMRLLESVGFGGGFLDFDGDGLLDVLMVSSPKCVLYRNSGEGKFVDVTQAAGLEAPGPWIGCAVGDYDNDGWSDLFISGYRRSALYRNQGNGKFREVSKDAGLTLSDRWYTAATFADFDRDGQLDLYVGGYCQFDESSQQYCVLHSNGVKTGCRPIDYSAAIGKCFRNRGDGTFVDVTKKWGLDQAHGKNLGAVVADYNGDGWPDLYLANDEMPADLFRNEKGQGFTDVAAEQGTAYSSDGSLMGGMGVDWGDINNDGWQDLAVGTFESEPKALFLNLAGKGFEWASGPAGILPATYSDVVFGTLLFDYDNDGWLDLLFVNGHTMDNIEQIRPALRYRQPAHLFRNQQNGTFQLANSPSLAVPIAGRAVACGDFENNGALGLLVVDMDGKVRLLRNTAASGKHWLKIDARGTRSNRDGLGAKVTLQVNGQNRVAEVASARSYLAACDRRVHFGLGDSTKVESVEVRWPSGEVTRIKDVPADQILTVTEGKGVGQ